MAAKEEPQSKASDSKDSASNAKQQGRPDPKVEPPSYDDILQVTYPAKLLGQLLGLFKRR